VPLNFDFKNSQNQNIAIEDSISLSNYWLNTLGGPMARLSLIPAYKKREYDPKYENILHGVKQFQSKNSINAIDSSKYLKPTVQLTLIEKINDQFTIIATKGVLETFKGLSLTEGIISLDYQNLISFWVEIDQVFTWQNRIEYETVKITETLVGQGQSQWIPSLTELDQHFPELRICEEWK